MYVHIFLANQVHLYFDILATKIKKIKNSFRSILLYAKANLILNKETTALLQFSRHFRQSIFVTL